MTNPYHEPRLLDDLKGRPVRLPSVAEHPGKFKEEIQLQNRD